MGDRVQVSLVALGETADRVRVVRGLLEDLDGLDHDPGDLGDPAVADAAVEVRRGWHLQRAALRQRLTTLAAFVDAAATTARDVDATIVSGRGVP